MTNQNTFVCLFTGLISTIITVHSLPLDDSTTPGETVAIFIPYAIKYVPVEVPDEYIKTLGSTNLASTPIVLNKADIKTTHGENSKYGYKSKDNEHLSLEEDNLNEDHINSGASTPKSFVFPSQDVISETSQINKAKSENVKDTVDVVLPVREEFIATTPKNDYSSASVAPLDVSKSPVAEHSTVGDRDTTFSTPHVISKRQAPGFFYYRPLYRYSRISTNRRRIHRPSRKHAMVGYLSDRDLFPTVA